MLHIRYIRSRARTVRRTCWLTASGCNTAAAKTQRWNLSCARGNRGRVFSAASLNPRTLPPELPSSRARNFRANSYLIFHRCHRDRVTGRRPCAKSAPQPPLPPPPGADGREFPSTPLAAPACKTHAAAKRKYSRITGKGRVAK